MLDVRSQPIMGYTLMAARACQPPIWVFNPTVTFQGAPERWRLAYVGCMAYNGIYPNGCPSRSTTYMGLHHDGDTSGDLLKDRGSPMLDARS